MSVSLSVGDALSVSIIEHDFFPRITIQYGPHRQQDRPAQKFWIKGAVGIPLLDDFEKERGVFVIGDDPSIPKLAAERNPIIIIHSCHNQNPPI